MRMRKLISLPSKITDLIGLYDLRFFFINAASTHRSVTNWTRLLVHRRQTPMLPVADGLIEPNGGPGPMP